MQEALKLAQIAADQGEIPVGAVVVYQHKIIGKGYNQTEKLNDVTAHAEMIALTAATQFMGAKYLKNCTLYVTLEPCIMCAGAIFWTQISNLIYGAADSKRGFSLIRQTLLHPKTNIVSGVLASECEMIVKQFFKELRG